MKKTAAVTILAMAFVLAACGNKAGEDAAGATAGTTASGPAPRSGAGDAVAASLQSTGTPVARLSFVVESRPLKGQPFTVKLLVSAAAPVQLELVATSPTLQVTPAAGTVAITAADTPATHDLAVTSQEEGLAEVVVRLKAGGGAETVYALPVLVMPAGGGSAEKAGVENGG